MTKDPQGWELGVNSVKLTPEFQQLVSATTTIALPEKLRMQFIHADHVVLPTKGLPTDWLVLGSSDHCAVQGVLQPGRVLTFQGHFEFDRFISTETIKVFGAPWDEAVRAEALRKIDADDDADFAAVLAASFLAGVGLGSKDEARKTGLLTPPEEA